MPTPARHRADDPRAGDLPRLRGDLEGADDAAHAADVGHERDPRHRDRRRDPRRRARRRRHADAGRRLRRAWCSATANVVGGFVVTDRMLEMFKSEARAERGRDEREPTRTSLYLVTIVSFILALRFLSSPRRSAARQPDRRGRHGARDRRHARAGRAENYGWICGRDGDRRRLGASARAVKMTAMPQMVALFNGVGGGAAALVALAEFHNLAPEPGRLPTATSRSRSSCLGADRLDLVRRLAGRVREAPGADQRPADHVSGAEVRERARCSRRVAARDRDRRGRESQWLLVVR